MEQLKILNMIARWGYLNLVQITLLLNKQIKTVETHLRFLEKKKLILKNQATKKNIYSLSVLGNRHIGKDSKKGHVNFIFSFNF